MIMHVDTPQTRCRAGIAWAGITPPVGIYHRMWGAATHDRAAGVHRPLTATALWLEPLTGGREQGQLVVALDHCVLVKSEIERMRQAASRAAEIASAQIHVSLSHTHAAGLMMRSRADFPGGDLIGPYLDGVASQVAELARQAIDSAQPATVVYGAGRCNLAANRDFRDEGRMIVVCGLNPDVPADDAILVAKIVVDSTSGSRRDTRRPTIATLVNYACHPTTLAWDNTLISPDYVGAMRETVEQETGAPCMFLQGASGDLGPREGFVGDPEVADRNGRQLGYAALAALEGLPTAGTLFEYTGAVVSGATIGTWGYRPLSPEALCNKHRWQLQRLAVELSYRPDLPDRATTEAKLADWQRKEQA